MRLLITFSLVIVLLASYGQSVPTCKLYFNPAGGKPSIDKNESFQIYFVYVWAGWVDGNSQVFFSDIHVATGTFSQYGNSKLFGDNQGMKYGWKEFIAHCKANYNVSGHASDRPCAISDFAPIWAHTDLSCLENILSFYKSCVDDAGGYYNDAITIHDFKYELPEVSKTNFTNICIQKNDGSSLCGVKGLSNTISEKKEEYKSANPGWFVDFSAAYKEAEKTGHPILFHFTNTDWCGWCKKFNAETLSKPEFNDWAKSNVVLLEVDMSNKIPKENFEANMKIVDDLQIKNAPMIWIAYPPGIGSMGDKWESLGFISGLRPDVETLVTEIEKLLERP